MILDTCALLFLASGDARLSPAARAQLAGATGRWFCSISTFEIALKHRQGQLLLPIGPLDWVRRLAVRYALDEIPLDSALCAAAAALPLHHRDPFDRFIVAAARSLALPVVTIDPKFMAYGVTVIS